MKKNIFSLYFLFFSISVISAQQGISFYVGGCFESKEGCVTQGKLQSLLYARPQKLPSFWLCPNESYHLEGKFLAEEIFYKDDTLCMISLVYKGVKQEFYYDTVYVHYYPEKLWHLCGIDFQAKHSDLVFSIDSIGSFAKNRKQEKELRVVNLIISDAYGFTYFRILNAELFWGISLRLYNAKGHSIYTSPDYHNDFDFAPLPSGTYYYELTAIHRESKEKVQKKSFVEYIKK